MEKQTNDKIFDLLKKSLIGILFLWMVLYFSMPSRTKVSRIDQQVEYLTKRIEDLDSLTKLQNFVVQKELLQLKILNSNEIQANEFRKELDDLNSKNKIKEKEVEILKLKIKEQGLE